MDTFSFTDRVRQVLMIAREQALSLRHEFVGTEHILLALIHEGQGVANAALLNLGANPAAIQQRIGGILQRGKSPVSAARNLPYTSRAKKVLELSMMEARELHHPYIGTEHLLLGLLREEKGIAAQVLTDARISISAARAEVLRLIGSPGMMSNKRVVQAYMDGFRRTDRKAILDCLTDDVEWEIPGMFHISGKHEFANHIVDEGFEGRPEITVNRLTEENDVVIAEGRVRAPRADGTFVDLAFCDVFEMQAGKIQKVVSYLVEIK